MSADYYSVLQKFQNHAFLLERSKPRTSEHLLIYYMLDQGSVVGIATRHGMDGPGIESQWGGARFFAPVQTCSGTHPTSYIMGTVSFSAVKLSGRGVDHPPLWRRSYRKSRAIPLLPLWAFVACSGRTLPLPLLPFESVGRVAQ